MFTWTRFKWVGIALMVLLLLVTRFADLGNLPKGLHADEASFLLNTYSLVHTGRDEDNQRWPLWFSSYIDSKPALYSYMQMPFVAVLGPTTTASRLPAAILGVASIVAAFWVLSLLLRKDLAVLTTLLLVVSPWHIVVSRSTQEVILAFLMALIAIGSFLTLQKKRSTKLVGFYFGLFLISALLSMYTYHSFKIFLPLLIGGWSLMEIWWTRSQALKPSKVKLLVTLNLILLGMAAFLTLTVAQSLERFNAINIFSEPAPLLIAEEQVRRATGITPLFFLRVFYNKLVSYGLSVIGIYGQHFSFDFFFLAGGQPNRYQIPFHGLLYLIEAILLPLGMFLSLHQPRFRKIGLMMLWWLVISPLPAALTSQEVPSMIRSFPMTVPLLAFITLACFWLWERRKLIVVKATLVLIGFGYIWGFAYFTQQFVVQKTQYQPWYRNTAEEKLAARLTEVEAEYDVIDIATVRDLYAYLALQNPDLIPLLQSQPGARRDEQFKLGKYWFNPRGCGPITYPETQKVLQVMTSGCELPPGYKVIETIRYDDRAEVYDLVVFDEELFRTLVPAVVAK